MAGVYAGSLWLNLRESAVFGALTLLLGAGGIMASACIYLVPARPAWNNNHTIVEFFLTGALLGPLFAASIGVAMERWLLVAAAIAGGAQMLNLALKFLRLTASDSFEMKASGRLLSTALGTQFLFRNALLVCGGIILPLIASARLGVCAAFVIAFCGEILGRYLFFVSVVPKNIAAPYLSASREAA